MRRKVALVIPSLRGGGAERVMINLIRHLNNEEFDLKLIAIKKEGPYLELIPENIKVIDLNSNRVRHSVFKLIKTLNEFKPDVVLSTLGHLNLLLLGIRKFLKGSPVLIVREANTPSQSLKKLPKMKRYFFQFLYKKLYPTADKIIAQCQYMKKDIIQEFNLSEEKIVTIYNPIDLQEIEEKSTLFNPYNQNETNIIAVGRLTYQKGFDILIDAFKKVNNIIPNSRLTILGDGELKEELNNQILKKGLSNNVSILGFKKNPYPYYKYADLYVLSSRWEGFPNTLLEALACGTKVVATDCKSGPREILGNNEYGILVKPKHVDSLANGIIYALGNKKISKNRATRYDILNIIKEYKKLLI